MPRKVWTEQLDQILRDRYSTDGPRRIAVDLSMTEIAVASRALRLGLRYGGWRHDGQMTRSRESDRVDVGFFSRPYSAEQAYVIGYVWADGCVTCSGKPYPRVLDLGCSVGDEEIVLQVRDTLKSNHAVFYKEPVVNPSINGYSCNTGRQIRCGITNMHLVKPLVEIHGVIPRKTWVDSSFPTNIPDEFLGHFCRGYLDGDGGVYPRPGRFEQGSVVFFGGRTLFLNGMRDLMVCVMDLTDVPVTPSETIFRFRWSNRADILKLYNWMYPPGDYPHGKRKRALMEEIVIKVA